MHDHGIPSEDVRIRADDQERHDSPPRDVALPTSMGFVRRYEPDRARELRALALIFGFDVSSDVWSLRRSA